MNESIGIGILGGTGYGAVELLRLLTAHPFARVVSVASQSEAGSQISKFHQNLEGFYDLKFTGGLDFDALNKFKRQIVFAALPHGVAASELEVLLSQNSLTNLSVIDLSGDLRLTDPVVHQNFYPKTPFAKELRQQFCYGLPELKREQIKVSRNISNPGCYATAAALSVAPLVDSSFKGSIHFDAKSGSSGAGRNLSDFTHHSKVGSSVTAYKVLSHQHEPEILQTLGDPTGERIKSMFVPQLLPTVRGIIVCSYISNHNLKSDLDLTEYYRNFYRDCPFVKVKDEPPSIRNVIGSNFCEIFVAKRDDSIVAISVIDNLVKGMAGQAIQNMNLICDLPEDTGLWTPGLGLI